MSRVVASRWAVGGLATGLAFVVWLAVSCTESPTAQDAKTPRTDGPTTVYSYDTEMFHGTEVFFPRQRQPESIGPLARGGGKLVLDDVGCIRMKPAPDDPGWVPIWPAKFALNTRGAEVRILDGKGRVVAEVGEKVVMGGGEVGLQKDIVDARTMRELRNRCPGGGYWLVNPPVRHGPVG